MAEYAPYTAINAESHETISHSLSGGIATDAARLPRSAINSRVLFSFFGEPAL
jgi:hypothetical protein